MTTRSMHNGFGADAAKVVEVVTPPDLQSVLDRLDQAGGSLPYRTFRFTPRRELIGAVKRGWIELVEREDGAALQLTDPGAAHLSTLETSKRSGYCECGCGGTTNIATHTDPKRDRIKGEPMRFMPGHNSVKTAS